jgi:thioredoxin 1
MKRSIIAAVLVTLFTSLLVTSCFADTKSVKKAKPLVTFVELGSVSCIPCKLMKPVMAEIEKTYGDSISVVFHDVNKDRQKASDYKIRVIPTQVFLDKKGKEFYRHEGFFPKEEIIKLVDKQLGITRTK